MAAKQILKKKKDDGSKLILYLDKEEALENLIEALEEYQVDFDLSHLSKKELKELFDNYADCIITFHPENHHQERAAFWRTRDILIKHGLSMDEINRAFDFI